MQLDRQFDGSLLILLCASTVENDQLFTVLGQVDAIPKPPVDLVLTNATKPIDLRGVAKLQSLLGNCDPGGSSYTQPVKPRLVGDVSILSDVLFEPDRNRLMVTHTLPILAVSPMESDSFLALSASLSKPRLYCDCFAALCGAPTYQTTRIGLPPAAQMQPNIRMADIRCSTKN